MSIPQVWVSTTMPKIKLDAEGPGAHWELVGIINTNQESEFAKHIQQMLGVRSTTPRTAEFYLNGHPDSPWVQADDHPPFWVAIDPYGAMRPMIHGAKPTYFVSNAMATVTRLARRPPENHPGDFVKYVKIPIRLKQTDAGFLTKRIQPDM